MLIAHISDIHVWDRTTRFKWTDFVWPLSSVKRIHGFVAVHLNRGVLFPSSVLARSLNDMCRVVKVDHTVISGDLTNVALEDEFAHARHHVQLHYLDPMLALHHNKRWVWQLLTVVPGNHDVYVPESVRRDYFGKFFADTLQSHRDSDSDYESDDGATVIVASSTSKHGETRQLFGSSASPPAHQRFPSVKVLRDETSKVVILSLNSGRPFFSSGALGEVQLQRANTLMAQFRDESDVFRIAVLHHPPVRREKKWWRDWLLGLYDPDRQRFARFCHEQRIDLVLNGHTHIPHHGLLSRLQQRFHRFHHGDVPSQDTYPTIVADPGSGTYIGQPDIMARYNVYRIENNKLVGGFARRWNPETEKFTSEELHLH